LSSVLTGAGKPKRQVGFPTALRGMQRRLQPWTSPEHPPASLVRNRLSQTTDWPLPRVVGSAELGQFAERRNHLGTTIRLCQEDAAGRQIVRTDFHEARSGENPDGRPSISDKAGELEPVHRAWHLNIGEDDVDVGSDLENRDGLVGITRLNHREPGLLDGLRRVFPDQELVFDDQNHGTFTMCQKKLRFRQEVVFCSSASQRPPGKQHPENEPRLVRRGRHVDPSAMSLRDLRSDVEPKSETLPTVTNVAAEEWFE
jgi:hypothetical protein